MKIVSKVKYWGLSALVVTATLGGVAATTAAQAIPPTHTAVAPIDEDPQPLEDVSTEDEYIDWVSVAAAVLGLDETAVYTALDEGKSLAELATDNGIDPQALIDAIVAAESEWINELVAAGDITADEAAEWMAELPEYATYFVNESYDESGEFDSVSWEAIAAEQLGLREDALWQALDEGKSIDELAAEAGVDAQSIIDAIVAAESEFINGLLEDGSISQEEADEWLAEVAEYASDFVEFSWDDADFEDEFEEDEFEYVDWDEVAATALGVTVDDLYEAYLDGKSLADLAAENNVELATITAALIDAETELIAGLVADGVLSQEEADEWLSYLAEEADDFVNEAWDESEGEEDFADVEYPDWDEATAAALGITIDELYAAYDENKSLTDIIAEQGGDPAAVIEAITAVETEFINSLVADGEISQEEADEWLAELPEIATDFVETDWDFIDFDDEYVEFDDEFVNEGFDDSEGYDWGDESEDYDDFYGDDEGEWGGEYEDYDDDFYGDDEGEWDDESEDYDDDFYDDDEGEWDDDYDDYGDDFYDDEGGEWDDEFEDDEEPIFEPGG